MDEKVRSPHGDIAKTVSPSQHEISLITPLTGRSIASIRCAGVGSETAFREKFQLTQDDQVDGLSPQELALGQGVSHTAVFVQGRLHRVLDMTTTQLLEAVAQVFRRIKMPQRARRLQKQLVIPNSCDRQDETVVFQPT